MRQYSAAELDPFPLDTDLTKAHHVIGVDDEVIYVPTGHKGKVTNIAHGNYYVTLPTGHAIACNIHDLCPADFPPADPATVKLSGFLPKARGLMRAIADGTISAFDFVLAQRAFGNVNTHRDTVDPFGQEESQDVRTLKLLAEKYSGVDTADAEETFTKAAHRPDADAEFKLHQKVRCKVTGKKGTITKLDYGFAHVANEDGTAGVTICHLLEAV